MPIQQQQQQQQQQFQLLPEPVKPAPPPPPSTVTVSGQTAHSSCGSGIVRLRGLTTADDSSQRSSFGIESPRTFMMDDFNYGWTSVDETPSVSHRGSTIDDCLPGWSSMVTYASRQVQTDFDASSVSVDFEAETFHSEYETMSHFIRDGPPPPPPPPAHMVTEHFVPIWQVPASSRSSTHSLHSLLSETTATNQSAAGGGKLRSYFSRSDSKRSSGERSVEELSYHDHILSLEPTSNSFISSLYSPEGMALPGFQEYRDRIFTEIQAYTAKGDWNLTNAVTSPIPSSPELRHPTRSRPGSSNSSWLAGPLLGKINNTYRIRPTGSRVAVAPAAKRWRGNGSGDVSPPAVETTTTAAATNEVSASAPQNESVHLSQQCSHALPDQQQLVQLLQHTREEEKQHFHLNGQIGNHASRPSSSTNICLPSHSSSRVESRASVTTSSSAVPSQSIPSSASSPVDNQSTTVVTVNRLPLDKSEPVAFPVHRSSYTSDHSLLCCVADAALQPSSLQRNLSSQRAQVAESSPPWKSGPPNHTQTPPPTLPPSAAAAAPAPITAVGDHSSSPSSSSSPPAIDGSVATVAKTSSPNAISTGGPPCPPFPSSVASSTAAAIQEPMEIHDDDDDVISHCCASPLLSAASCHQHHHHQPHMNSPRAPLPPPLADSAGLDSPPPTPPTLLLLSPPLSPGPVAFTETSERDDDEIAKVQTTVDCTPPFTYVMPHSYSVNGQQSEKDDEKKEEKEIMIRSAVLHPNDTTLIAPGSPFGYSAPATPMQDENVTAQDQGEGQQQQQQQHAGHEGKTVETNVMSSPERAPSSSSSSQLAGSSIASSSRFEVLAAELSLSTPAGLTQTEGRSRPLRLLSSDSDVTDNDDSCSNGAGGGFDTDTQQETVVQGLNNAAYNDLRQFAIKQSSSQKDVAASGASSAVASSPVQLLDPQSDTDSSSSISSQQPPAKRSSNGGGSVTASPVLSDGRSTPRRQYTSYVLIKGGNSGGKASTGSSSGSSDHVISDDESGVTVTLPREPATAAAASIVQVPASPTGTAAEWMAGEEDGGGSDSETNEESGSCVTISGNGVLTDHDLATSDDEEMNSERNGVSSKLAKYFTFELESAAGYTADHSARKQPVVHRNQVEMRSSVKKEKNRL
jgi:hypothetical protein